MNSISKNRLTCSIKFLLILIFSCNYAWANQKKITQFYVAVNGNDKALGSKSKPFATLEAANQAVLKAKAKSNNHAFEIILLPGTYYVDKPIVFTSKNSGTRNSPLKIKSTNAGNVILSAGKPLNTKWEKFKGKIYKTYLPNIDSIPILYGDNQVITLARYPNKQTNVNPYGGYAADVLSTEKVATWKNPEGGFIHAMHNGTWGGMHYLIKGISESGKLMYEGGWQNNRPSDMHPTQRFVENIFEELDAPGEWFFDKTQRFLYYYPLEEENVHNMNFIAGQMESIIQLKGTAKDPVKHVHLEGIEFKHTVPTFMKTKEQLTRSDWAIYRMGALVFDGTTDCSVQNSSFTLLGGNAVFVSNYNRNVKVASNLIEQIGASAIAFIGNVNSVRSPSMRYEEFVPLEQLDRTSGPKTDDYPANCTASDNLIRQIGLIEKQVAGVQIQIASRIQVIHNSISFVPRAGINIGDGAFGGHLLAHNDVFNTVLETGDHGAFNSWGRDRFWHPDRNTMDKITDLHPELILLDAVETTVIRDNRFHCEHGWDIDLDDGSSNYEIYNNLCLSGGLKLREGFHRRVYNNIMINNGFHPHVWFKNSQDVFKKNIVMTSHQAIQIDHWGDTVDFNFFVNEPDLKYHQSHKLELGGTGGDPQFVNVAIGDFTLKASSPFLEKGFKNFPMDQFGVQSKRLKKLATYPKIVQPKITKISEEKTDTKIITWHGADIKNVETLGEQSAAGLPTLSGVLILTIPNDSFLEKSDIKVGDVILRIENTEITDVVSLLEQMNKYKGKATIELGVWRSQRINNKVLKLK